MHSINVIGLIEKQQTKLCLEENKIYESLNSISHQDQLKEIALFHLEGKTFWKKAMASLFAQKGGAGWKQPQQGAAIQF